MLDCMERASMVEYADEYRRKVRAVFAQAGGEVGDEEVVRIKYDSRDASMFHRCAEMVARRHDFAVAMNGSSKEVVAGTVEQVQAAKRAWGFMKESPHPRDSAAEPEPSPPDGGGVFPFVLTPRPGAAPSRAHEDSTENARD
jgi:hypothetical protein